jgi:hypothetical protein
MCEEKGERIESVGGRTIAAVTPLTSPDRTKKNCALENRLETRSG